MSLKENDIYYENLLEKAAELGIDTETMDEEDIEIAISRKEDDINSKIDEL